jgi:hypothetical protein
MKYNKTSNPEILTGFFYLELMTVILLQLILGFENCYGCDILNFITIQDCSLLGYDAVFKVDSTLKTEVTCSSGLLVTTYKVTRSHNPEDRNPHSNRNDNFRFPVCLMAYLEYSLNDINVAKL